MTPGAFVPSPAVPRLPWLGDVDWAWAETAARSVPLTAASAANPSDRFIVPLKSLRNLDAACGAPLERAGLSVAGRHESRKLSRTLPACGVARDAGTLREATPVGGEREGAKEAAKGDQEGVAGAWAVASR